MRKRLRIENWRKEDNSYYCTLYIIFNDHEEMFGNKVSDLELKTLVRNDENIIDILGPVCPYVAGYKEYCERKKPGIIGTKFPYKCPRFE